MKVFGVANKLSRVPCFSSFHVSIKKNGDIERMNERKK